MNVAEEARAAAKKAIQEKKLKAEEELKISGGVAEEESRTVREHILSIVRQAAARGEYFVDISGVTTDINKLSTDALRYFLKSLRAEELGVALTWAVYPPFIGDPRPHRHDIEGWEEYNRKVAEGTVRLIDKISISWL